MCSTEIDNFCGVYMLYCLNEKYKGRIYIGFTVNPNRRLKQHNAGKDKGGAWKTSNRGPWNMILIVHGFPSSVAALQFEWAWQNPHQSRRLKHVSSKARFQKVIDYKLQVLSAMLQVGPWNRLPLTIRWLDEDFGLQFNERVSAPLHMPVVFGKVTAKKLSKQKEREPRESKSPDNNAACSICRLVIIKPKQKVECINPQCRLIAHLTCLAEIFTRDDGRIIPVSGDCPSCKINVLWGDLIRKKIGCNLHLEAKEESDFED